MLLLPSLVTCSVGGVLTYEDVANVDSVGIITARAGVAVLGAGVTVTGIATFHNGADFNAVLIENVNIVANKLSAVPNINLDNGMVHYYTTNETTTANPNVFSTVGINTEHYWRDWISVLCIKYCVNQTMLDIFQDSLLMIT